MQKIVVRIANKTGIAFSKEIEARQKLSSTLGKGRLERVEKLYFILADVLSNEVERFAYDALLDKAAQEYAIYTEFGQPQEYSGLATIDVVPLPGVMDPEALTVASAMRKLLKKNPWFVLTGYRYVFSSIDEYGLKACAKALYNPLIEHCFFNELPDVFDIEPPKYAFERIKVPLLSMDDDALMELSRKATLSLNLREMKAIQSYFSKEGRNPTDVEIETIAQTWSEHCQHKTFKSPIRYIELNQDGTLAKEEVIGSLFKDYIMKATEDISHPMCLSVFKDNAGVIEFSEREGVCFKVETHNHPSALEPFGGANTGVGGVIRDVLGCGLGAKPIANTDVFCFGRPDADECPDGVIPPIEIFHGVVSGVRDYGNKMGIPTVNGAVYFDNGFAANPLVFCGTVGIMPKNAINKKVYSGQKIVLVGGRTGRDGIHGATFSSAEITQDTHQECGSAVQIGNPIEEKRVMDVLLQIRDKGYYSAITDCGAGGLSSAVGEMADGVGAVVWLDKVGLKYSGLSYTEIWISESQERMVLAVNPEFLDDVIEAFAKEDVEAACIGEFTNDNRLKLFYKGHQVMDMDLGFLHSSVPLDEKKAVWVNKQDGIEDLGQDACPDIFRKVLSSYNVSSKHWVVEQYDHEVQGGSVVKPLAGWRQRGVNDGAVIRPHLHGKKAVAVACGINPSFGLIDPYWMAANCIDEAIRQLVALGANPEKIALLDNFCWGNPDKEDRLGGLVRAAKGCYDFATAYGTPFISGKDSLYNEYNVDGKSMPIPGTLLISAIAVIDDIKYIVTSQLKSSESLLYVVGLTKPELGGSEYLRAKGMLGAAVPAVDARLNKANYNALHTAIKEGLCLAIHDVSDGGLGVAAAEMAFGAEDGIGLEMFLVNVPFAGEGERADNTVLFSESAGRLIVEIQPKHKGRFEKIFEGLPCEMIGRTNPGGRFIVCGLSGDVIIDEKVEDLYWLWRKPLEDGGVR